MPSPGVCSKLELNGNKVIGPIPKQISDLKDLEYVFDTRGMSGTGL